MNTHLSKFNFNTSFILPVVFLFLSASAFSYENVRYSSQQFDNSSGLSNSCLNVIYEDSEHLMWFGSWDGLNVYDGSSFRVFNYKTGITSKSLLNNVVDQIVGDQKKGIWIATREGLSRYDKKDGTFKHYLNKKEAAAKEVDKGFLLASDADGNIYSSHRYGFFLLKYNANTDAFEKCILPGAHRKIKKIVFDSANRLWVLNESGSLEVFVAYKGNFSRLYSYSSKEGIFDFFYVNNKIFYSSGGKLYESDTFLKFKFVTSLPHTLKTISFFKNKYILAWSSKGLGEFDEHFNKSNTLLREMPVLADLRITFLKQGSQGILWIGTDGSGAFKVSETPNYFGLVKKLPDGRALNIPTRAFNKVNDELWIGTKGNGIIKIKNFGKANSSYSITRNFYSVSDLLENCVYAIEKGANHYVYVGFDAEGVAIFDSKQNRWYGWKQIENTGNYPTFDSVHCILIDKDGSVWLGLKSYGLIHLKIEKNSNGNPSLRYLKRYPYTGNNKGPGNSVIYTLVHGSGNKILVGCRYGGLSIFDRKTGIFRTIRALAYEGGLSNNDVLCLYKDKSNKVWVGTSYGLNYIDEKDLENKEPVFYKFTSESGLPNNTVHAVSQDNEGFIWASTNKGLVKIDQFSKKIVWFKEGDGLQSDEFSDNAVWKDEKGYLYFGGIYGFNRFLPKDIKTSSYQPNLLLSELQIAGNEESGRVFSVLNHRYNADVNKYIMASKDNFLGLKVTAIDFASIDKCQYAYFLEGNDKVWQYLGEDNRISYNNLPPGDYRLKLKWTTGNGIWTKEVTAFDIEVKQVFWLTWPAFLCYFLIVFTGVYVFYNYRKNRVKMLYQLSMELMMRKKEEEVHQEQLDFFTNIAHELQTPLTLIMGALERFFLKNNTDTKSGNNYFLSIVNQQASRLNYLVYQLLEFRRAEAGHLKSYYNYVNVSDLLENIAELFSQLNDQKKLDFTCDIQKDIELWIDKDKLEKIIFNLLSNAFKHTLPGEFVSISVKHNRIQHKLEMVVSNTGCNLTQDELKRLFSRFFVVDDTQQSKISSGIGLAFTKQLVMILKGDIKVNLEGSCISFHVELPSNYIPAEEEKLKDSIDKLDTPSYLLTSMAIEQESDQDLVITENNKQSILNSVDNAEKKSILIIEDEPSIRYLLRDILKENYVVYEAGNGKQALEIVRRIVPNLIVSDIMMPDMTGLEVCKIIKNTPKTSHIPFVILSARGTIEQQTEGYEVGADAYIPKPFQAEHLLVRVKKLLDYQQRLHDLFNNDHSPVRIPDVGMGDSDKEFLERILALIEANIEDENLDAVFIEEKLGMSKANFYRKLKALSGMTPGELIKNIRLQQAASLLENSDLTVSQILYKTGFNNQSHFYKEFKKKYNSSPAEYRADFKLPV